MSIEFSLLFFFSPLPLVFAFFTQAPGPDTLRQGIDLYKGHRYAEAAATLEKTLSDTSAKQLPDYAEAVLTLGQSYFMLSQAPKAIPWLQQAPPSNESFYMLGYAYLQTRQPAKSAEAFAHLFGLRPDSAAGHLMAAQMMLKKDYDTAAAEQVNAALALDSKLPEAHFLLAEIDLFRGRVDDGIAELRRELAVNPNLAKAWYRLGEALTRQQKWDEAIPELQRAVWLNPEYSGPYIVLGKCYVKKQNWANAEGILRRAVAIDPDNQQANYYLGQTLIAQGKTEEGRALLDKMRSKIGDRPGR